MNFIRSIFNQDEDVKDIVEENKQLHKKRKYTKKELENLRNEKDEIVAKYVSLLEEKAKGFDQYLHYQELYSNTYNIVKEQKKEIADLKSEVKRLNEELEKQKKRKRSTKNVKEEK